MKKRDKAQANILATIFIIMIAVMASVALYSFIQPFIAEKMGGIEIDFLSRSGEQKIEEQNVAVEDDFLIVGGITSHIIQFEDEPILERKLKLEKENKDIEKEIKKYSEDIEENNKKTITKIKEKVNEKRKKPKDEKLKIGNKFSKVFNGISLNLSGEELQEIGKLSGVKKIYLNLQVNATLMDSIPLINADDVWQLDANENDCSVSGEECLTGEGVSVAIIDTGVDYTHGDLGGCFGIGCKVVDGYDFVNDDNNPMDDHGHGTHVAGTAAGNGVLKGVAPDALVYAYKVLGSGGGGYTDWVIAGIERAVDPNQDMDFSDHVDVISMSLGGFGTPDDPMSQAVDNAVNNGIVVVVAAGNSGPGERTVGSPGTARKVITVGASYKGNLGQDVIYSGCTDLAPQNTDQIACFSSRGPVVWQGGIIIKPDIIAPGVEICAAQWDTAFGIDDEYNNPNRPDVHRCLDSEHVAISGTSMATPHVAGAVALLIQKNPGWSPEDIKNALKITAVDIGYDINMQGKGRIDILSAIQLTKPPIARIESTSVQDGLAEITFTAQGEEFLSYVLDYGVEDDPDVWIEIKSDSIPVNSETESFVLPVGTGYMTIRLRVTDIHGITSEDISLVRISTLKIAYPANNGLIPNTFIDVSGSAFGTDFVEYTLEVSSLGVIEGPVTTPVENGILGTLDGSLLEEDQTYTLTLRVQTTGGSERIVQSDFSVITEFENMLSGFPIYVTYEHTDGKIYDVRVIKAPIIGDIDNDGYPELVYTGFIPYDVIGTYRYDGIIHPGWPKYLGDKYYFKHGDVVLGDLNNDNKLEIVAANNFVYFGPPTEVFVWDESGELLPGWPKGYERNLLGGPNIVLEDVDNDGFLDIIMRSSTYDGGYQAKIYAWSAGGETLPGWPITIDMPHDSGWKGGLVIGDVIGDESKEIIIPLSSNNEEIDSRLVILDNQGSEILNQPISGASNLYSPVLGDIDNDGNLEIILGVDSSTTDKVYVFNGDGSIAQGWPKDIGERPEFVSLADFDFDGYLEIVVGTRNPAEPNSITVLDYLGNEKQGWPIFFDDYYLDGGEYMIGMGMRQGPVIGDIDGDGNLEIMATQSYTCPGQIFGCPWRVKLFAWHDDGVLLEGYPKTVSEISADYDGSPIITDLNKDGKVDIIVVMSRDNQKGGESYIYAYSTLGNYDENFMDWPMYGRDAQHTGVYTKLARQKIDSCQDLDEFGKTYYLTKDLSGAEVTESCFNIKAENVILDCQGKSITSSSILKSIIYSQKRNIVIRNCHLIGSYAGRYYDSSAIISQWAGSDTNNLIENNIIEGFGVGIDIKTGNNLLQNNVLNDNIKAIHLMSTSNAINNIVKNNLVKNNRRGQGWGLTVWGGSGNQFINNKVYNNRYGVLLNHAHDTIVRCTTFSENSNDFYSYTDVTGTVRDDSDCSDVDCVWEGDECLDR